MINLSYNPFKVQGLQVEFERLSVLENQGVGCVFEFS